MLQEISYPSRRFNARITPPRDVWVYWSCNGRDDVSRTSDLSFGGVFLETKLLRSVGTPAKIDFLVDEGQIRAEAVIRHVRPGLGFGLKFVAVTEQDRPRLAALFRRLRR